MIERILLNFKPGVSQSSPSVFWFLPRNQPRHRGYDVDFRWYREFVTRNKVSSRMEASRPPRRPASTRLRPIGRLPPTFDFGVTRRRGKQQPLMHRSLLRRANVGYGGPRAAYDRWLTRIYLCFVLICGNQETFNRLALDESIHNVRDVGDRDASVK